jgi:hypothetical protein
MRRPTLLRQGVARPAPVTAGPRARWFPRPAVPRLSTRRARDELARASRFDRQTRHGKRERHVQRERVVLAVQAQRRARAQRGVDRVMFAVSAAGGATDGGGDFMRDVEHAALDRPAAPTGLAQAFADGLVEGMAAGIDHKVGLVPDLAAPRAPRTP